MAVHPTREQSLQILRLPQSKYVDALRWLPSISAFDRYTVLATFDSDSDTSLLEIHSLNPSSVATLLDLQSSWSSSSRVSSLKVSLNPHKPLIAASTYSGSFHVLFLNPTDASLEAEVSVPEKKLHVGTISCVDVQENGGECVSVGEDGRVNLISVGDSGLDYRRVFDSKGLASYTSAKWASQFEFATGGFGFTLQWWDKRTPDARVSNFKGHWQLTRSQGGISGIVHSIDIHPSRKHTCLAGGSSGTIFAWDLRWQQQPIILSGVGTNEIPSNLASESDVWEVQYDTHVLNQANSSSTRILPAMFCSEDGIIAVIEQGEEPKELLAEPCAINNFDIDRQNPSDVMCSLEWESIVLLTRS